MGKANLSVMYSGALDFYKFCIFINSICNGFQIVSVVLKRHFLIMNALGFKIARCVSGIPMTLCIVS